MLLSIIIPFYNSESYLEDCIQSCYNQNVDLNDYELILVNDGSTDNSLVIASLFSKEHENLHIINKKNGGLSSARNRGVEVAKGDYVMFLDSDDWLETNSLGFIFSQLYANDVDILGICAADVIGNQKRRRQRYTIEGVTEGKNALNDYFQVCATFAVWNVGFLKYNNLSFYYGIFHEDEDFTPKGYYLARKVVFINEIIYLVRQTPNSITRSFNPKKSFDLINVVCPRLLEFSKQTDIQSKQFFISKVGLLVCGALHNVIKADLATQQVFLNQLLGYPEYEYCLVNNSKRWVRFYSIFYKRFPNKRIVVFSFVESIVKFVVKIRERAKHLFVRNEMVLDNYN